MELAEVVSIPKSIDLIKAEHAFRVVALFRVWSDARPGRVMRTTTLRLPTDVAGMVEIKLFQDGQVVAEAISGDYFDALAHAIQITSIP